MTNFNVSLPSYVHIYFNVTKKEYVLKLTNNVIMYETKHHRE